MRRTPQRARSDNSLRPQLTRRTALAGLGTALAGTAALALWPDNTTAIAISGLTIDNRSVDLAPSETVEQVTLRVNGEYDHAASHELDRREIQLHVDVNGVGYEPLATTETANPQTEVTGQTVQLDANLLDHSGLSAGMLDVSEGQTTTASLGVRLELHLFKNGREVGLADAQTTTDLAISKSELTVSAQIGGTGGYTVEKGTLTATP